MSNQYDTYLTKHKDGVSKAFEWINSNMHELIYPNETQLRNQIATHDESKFSPEEYDAYDAYFYGNNKTFMIVENFNKAWLHHIHNNPHHWQHWVLLQDEGTVVCVDMPMNYIIEMICDWWSFSWTDGNLFEIFDWYEDNKKNMDLSDVTRTIVEGMLNQIREILELNSDDN
ncbi:MAG: DUF5662 family protein [Turicibacter bilis]|nr:DUF5662 family protein [Turicibacter bilis]